MNFRIFRMTGVAMLMSLTILVMTGCGNKMKKWELIKGGTVIHLAPEHGGRISQITFNNKPILAPLGVYEDLYGSVWWPSPQEDWIWPPPAALNDNPYMCTEKKGEVWLSSQNCHHSGLQLNKVIKQFDENHFEVAFRVMNITDKTKTLAHWDITRFNREGRIIFPKGGFFKSDIGTPKLPFITYPTIDHPIDYLLDKSGRYYDFDAKISDVFHDKKTKLCADASEGWCAYLANNVLIIKSFDDIPVDKIAPNQGEVEVYIADDTKHMELELQSAFVSIAPRQSSEWKVSWLIFELDESKYRDTGLIVDFIHSKLTKHKLPAE